jgi:ankyrin repeat protein
VDGKCLQEDLTQSLLEAQWTKNWNRVKDLLMKNVDVNAAVRYRDYAPFTPFHLAARYCKSEIVALMLAKGARINDQDPNGCTALMHTFMGCTDNDVEAQKTVKVLLSAGADFRLRSKFQATALHYAISCPSEQLIKLLLEKGANLNALDGSGSTPLITAIKYGDHLDNMRLLKNIKLLLEYGADVDVRDNFGKSALDYAAAQDRWEAVELLKKYGLSRR